MCFLLIYCAIFSPWCPGSCPLWGGATTVVGCTRIYDHLWIVMSLLPFDVDLSFLYPSNLELRTNHRWHYRFLSRFCQTDAVSFKRTTGLEPVFALEAYQMPNQCASPLDRMRLSSLRSVSLTYLRSHHHCTMADPFSLATGVLGVVGFVLQIASGAMAKVDKTITAHNTQQRAIRDLRRELEKTIKGATHMQTVLSIMLGDPKDKTVKRMRKKCVSFRVVCVHSS